MSDEIETGTPGGGTGEALLNEPGAVPPATPPEGAAPLAAPEPAPPGEPPAPAAPEQYERFALPEGLEGFEVDDQTQADFSALCREMRLTQEQGQKLFEFGASRMSDGMQSVRLEVKKKIDGWRAEAQSDKEIMNGGLNEASKLLAMTDDGGKVKDLINETGIGNSAVFIRWCMGLAKLLGEDGFVGSQKREGGTLMTGYNSMKQLSDAIYKNVEM
jgi:hypothetical protein